MLNETVLKIVLNNKTFGQREASEIVGGRGRLFRLVGEGKIRAEKKPSNRQNGRWYCNAWDCIKWAEISYRENRNRKKTQIKKRAHATHIEAHTSIVTIS